MERFEIDNQKATGRYGKDSRSTIKAQGMKSDLGLHVGSLEGDALIAVDHLRRREGRNETGAFAPSLRLSDFHHSLSLYDPL
jgi:hypothetical protein